MERRVLLAIFLCFLVAVRLAGAVREAGPEARSGRHRDAASTSRHAGTPAAPRRRRRPPAPPPRPQAQAAAAPCRARRSFGDTSERDVRVETRDVIAVFTNRGARLKSWRLKHYLDQQKQPQELVEPTSPTQPLPFTLRDGRRRR